MRVVRRDGVCSTLLVVIVSLLSSAPWLLVVVHADGLVCDRATLSAASTTKWSVFCDSLASTKLSFDPSRVTNLFVDPGNSVALQSQTPTQIYLSSAFHHVNDLISTKLTTL